MRSRKKKSFHEHLIAIGVAIVIVAATSVAFNRSGLLNADILQGGVSATILGDISYDSENAALTIHGEKSFAEVKSLTFMVVYNPETVTVGVKESQTSYDYTSSSGKEGVDHVTVFFPGKMSADEKIVSIPFEGNQEDITISDATVVFNDGTVDTLAIKKK